MLFYMTSTLISIYIPCHLVLAGIPISLLGEGLSSSGYLYLSLISFILFSSLSFSGLFQRPLCVTRNILSICLTVFKYDYISRSVSRFWAFSFKDTIFLQHFVHFNIGNLLSSNNFLIVKCILVPINSVMLYIFLLNSVQIN